MDDLCKEKDFDSVSFGGNIFGNWGLREIMPNKKMGTPRLYKFEEIKIYGAEDCDGYLTSLYQDWRQFPPKEKQVTHHDYLSLDLKNGYM